MDRARQRPRCRRDRPTGHTLRGSEVRLERYGQFVYEYWADGQYGFVGFTNTPDWVFTPTAADVASGADQVGAGIRERVGA